MPEKSMILRRREANRLAAQRFRNRKKGYQDSLEDRVRTLELERDELLERVEVAEAATAGRDPHTVWSTPSAKHRRSGTGSSTTFLSRKGGSGTLPPTTTDESLRLSGVEAANRRLQDENKWLQEDNARLQDMLDRWVEWSGRVNQTRSRSYDAPYDPPYDESGYHQHPAPPPRSSHGQVPPQYGGHDATLLLGGGGGANKSGIGNKLKLVDVSRDGRRIKDVYELRLSSEEDAPMTLALDRATSQLVTGINASQESIEGGKNEQCRTFSYADKRLAFVRSQNTISAQWSDDYPYQKLTALSIPPTEGASASFVATGTTENRVTVLKFPSLDIVVPPFDVDGGDLVDLNWGGPLGTLLAVTTTSQLHVYAFASGKLTLMQSIAAPKGDDAVLAFRAARFAPDSPERPSLLAALNSAAQPRRDARRKARKSYVAKFEPSTALVEEVAEKDEKQETLDEKADDKAAEEPSLSWKFSNKREVAGKPITVFDVSPNGRLVSFGCSDLSIGMLDAHTLSPLLKILHAHSFPPTALKFNPTATMLVSASADNTIRIVVVPSSFGASVPSTLVMLILALFVFLLAVLLRK
ncbi:hypothetical protein CcaverHIS641_0206810 [Cutaneotrichosporon cavernicola]|nr:hypothetical protein CcaverHIS641_0206810 [Cutaneotrichosporon cavernicola]